MCSSQCAPESTSPETSVFCLETCSYSASRSATGAQVAPGIAESTCKYRSWRDFLPFNKQVRNSFNLENFYCICPIQDRQMNLKVTLNNIQYLVSKLIYTHPLLNIPVIYFSINSLLLCFFLPSCNVFRELPNLSFYLFGYVHCCMHLSPRGVARKHEGPL